MTIPAYQSIMLPLMRIAEDGQEHKSSEAYVTIAQQLHLSEDELKQLVPSGQDYLFNNRCGWAKTYLKKAGLIIYPTRGRFRITQTGSQLLAENPSNIDIQILKRFPEFLDYWNGGNSAQDIQVKQSVDSMDETETPEDKLESASLQIRNEVRSELLNKLKSVSPAAFELIVLRLIQKMGYGDEGQTLGKSHDGGIDGLVRQDRLGLDRIYFQAKRWKDSTVGASPVRDFVGALAGIKAKRGVFITSSKFSSDAISFVNTLGEYSVILIDGERLADLMYEYQLGATITKTYSVKRVDNDFFDDIEDS
jgi:restriction system protein